MLVLGWQMYNSEFPPVPSQLVRLLLSTIIAIVCVCRSLLISWVCHSLFFFQNLLFCLYGTCVWSVSVNSIILLENHPSSWPFVVMVLYSVGFKDQCFLMWNILSSTSTMFVGHLYVNVSVSINNYRICQSCQGQCLVL